MLSYLIATGANLIVAKGFYRGFFFGREGFRRELDQGNLNSGRYTYTRSPHFWS